MSWSSDSWMQDDAINGGYPMPSDTAVPIAFDAEHLYTEWSFDPFVNAGYPYIVPILEEYPVSVPDIHPPVVVFASDETDFTHNGLRILSPTECTEDHGEKWEVFLTHPIDPDRDWTGLQVNNILRVPCTFRGKQHPQIFRIYRAVTSMAPTGTMQRVVYARHIFYDLNDVLVDDVRPTDLSGDDALRWIMDHAYRIADEEINVAARFSSYSDILQKNTAYYHGISLTAALIGEDNCFLNRWGGELYRDNFYFSVCTSMENSLQNAFSIDYSIDMIEIEEDIDYSDYCSHLVADSNVGYRVSISHYHPAISRPHHVVRHATFSYDIFDKNTFWQDVEKYFATIRYPKISYRVKFADLKNTQLYAGFINLQYVEYGDTGTINHQLLDISTIQKVVRKRVDLLTGEVLEIQLGNLPSSLTKKKPYSNTVTTGVSATEKRMTAAEVQALGSWADAKKLTWGQLKKHTWQQVKGGNP